MRNNGGSKSQRQGQLPCGWQSVRLGKVAELNPRRAARELAGEAEEIENAVYDQKAVDPNAKGQEDTRTPEELLDLIEAMGRQIAEALAVPRDTWQGKDCRS